MMENDPSHPKWITFFDGEQYQQYQNFMRTRDFNKILESQRDSQAEKIPVQDFKTWPPMEMTSHPDGGMTESPYHRRTSGDEVRRKYKYIPYVEYSEIPADEPLPPPVAYPKWAEARARRKRTWTYVLLGVLSLSLIAMLVALLLHFHFEKSLFGSIEVRDNGTTTPPPFYGSFSPKETTANRTTLRSSAKTNTQIISQSTGSVLFKSLTKASAIFEDLPSLAFEPNKNAVEVPAVTTNNPQGQVFPVQTVTAANVVANLGEKSITLMCVLKGIGEWQSVSIVKLSELEPKEKTEVAVMSSLSQKDTKAADPRMKPHFLRIGSDVKFMVQIDGPDCNDDGFYNCRAIIKQGLEVSSRFRVVLTMPVKNPVLQIPDELIEGKPTWMKATWHSGYPKFIGVLEWEIYNKSVDSYSLLEYTNYKEQQDTRNCTTIVEVSVLITPTFDWNESWIRAQVNPTSPDTNVPADQSKNLISKPQLIKVVPNSICDGIENDSFKSHPYTCNKFIRCTTADIHVFACPNNLCFDLNPETCIRESSA